MVLADASLLAAGRAARGRERPGRRHLAPGAHRSPRTRRSRRVVPACTSPDTRKDAERRLYADLGSVIDTRLDRLVHRPLSRHLTRVAVALGLSPNLISLANLALGLLAASYLAKATVGNTVLGILIYFASAVLDHVDGEVARLTCAESRLGEWLDVTVDNVVHAFVAVRWAWPPSASRDRPRARRGHGDRVRAERLGSEESGNGAGVRGRWPPGQPERLLRPPADVPGTARAGAGRAARAAPGGRGGRDAYWWAIWRFASVIIRPERALRRYTVMVEPRRWIGGA